MKKAIEINEKTPWQELTTGGEIAEPATSVITETGQWRSYKVVYKPENCKQCLLCALYCPDSSIPVSESKRSGFDYGHCKGCGICFRVCPFGAIDFVKEGEGK